MSRGYTAAERLAELDDETRTRLVPKYAKARTEPGDDDGYETRRK